MGVDSGVDPCSVWPPVLTMGHFQPMWEILWMDKILHHFETMGSHFSLVFKGESSFQGFLGGAKRISSIHSIFLFPVFPQWPSQGRNRLINLHVSHNQNPVLKWSTQNHASRIKKAEFRSYFRQGDCPLLTFTIPGF